MRPIAHSSSPLPEPVIATRTPSIYSTAGALLMLTKPRLAFFSILSAMAAYACVQAPVSPLHILWSLAGISFAAGGALSLNQWWERSIDSQMQRTRSRPLPQEQLTPGIALAWSLGLSATGISLLYVAVNPLSAALAASTIVLYGLVYTPLKRRTVWATELGSFSGALPPLLGAAAAGDVFSPAAWLLAALLLFWQMPHFYGIGWMYQKDYRAAGFPLLPAVDSTGQSTAFWSLFYTLCLGLVSLLPWLFGPFGVFYGIPAAIGFAYLLSRAIAFQRNRTDRDAAARKLFLATVIYLPPLMTAIAVDRFLSL